MTGHVWEVLIGDAHPLSREGLRTLFTRHLDITQIDEAQDAGGVEAKLRIRDRTGLLVVDLALPSLNGGRGLRDIRTRYPDLTIVVVAGQPTRGQVLEVLAAGVHGFVPKDTPVGEMVDALQAVMDGRVYVPRFITDLSFTPRPSPTRTAMSSSVITSRQAEVLDLLSAGHSNKEIARRLQIAEGTVKVHIAAAFRALGVHNRVSAAAAMQTKLGSARADDWSPNLLERLPGDERNFVERRLTDPYRRNAS